MKENILESGLQRLWAATTAKIPVQTQPGPQAAVTQAGIIHT